MARRYARTRAVGDLLSRLPVLGPAISRARLLQVGGAAVATLVGFRLAGTLVELLGLLTLLPVFQYVQANGDVTRLIAQHAEWRWLAAIYDTFGLPLRLSTLLCTSFVLLIVRQIFAVIRLRYEAWIRETAVMRLRQAMFQGFVLADMRYQEAQPMGSVVADMTVEIQRALESLFAAIAIVGVGLLLLVYGVGLIILSWSMTLAALGVFGLAFVALRRHVSKSRAAGYAFTDANRNLSDFLMERLRQIRLIRLAGTERAEIDEMNRLSATQRNVLVRIFRIYANLEMIMEPIVISAAFALLYVGIIVLGMPIEQIGLFLLILLRLLPVVKEVARYRQATGGAQASYEAVVARLDAMTAARERPTGTKPFLALTERVRFDDVRFAYPGRAEKPALDGLTLEIPARRMTALVGPSGAGKSTLVDLLPRLRSPDSGRLTFDGVPIGEFDLESLRAGVAYLPQTPHLFDVPIAEHIRYGKPDATEAEIVRAAELAGVDRFANALPAGYTTRCGTGGSRLSGGQRQRLDLARALVRRAPLLLLDEPTANLDAESEALLREALERIRRETAMTIVVVAHRFSTVALADQIVVLDRGRVAAIGRHDELLAAGGWYADAFRKQTIIGADAPAPAATG